MGLLWCWRSRPVVLVVIFMFHGFCYSRKAPHYVFMKEATSAPEISYYDYIIIGGGTSGCPLAATLSEIANVLVLERGGSPYENPRNTDLDNFLTTLLDTSPSSPSQQFISEDGVYNARARILGGGSVINAGFYSRAEASFIKEVGWDEDLVNKSYLWVENKVVFEPTLLQWQSALRDALLEAGVLPYNGFTYNHIIGTKIGGTIFDSDGHRHTAADLLDYANPDKITVYLHATVGRILSTGRTRPRAECVIFEDASRVSHRACININNTKNEIILSAGAIGSPQLLMLSGVGPAKHLEAHNIEMVLDQPMVGQGMSDNPLNALLIPSPIPVEVSLVEVVGITSFGSYIQEASGLNFANFWTQRLSFHESAYALLSNQTGQSSKLATSEAVANTYETLKSFTNGTLNVGVIGEKVTGPISTGHLELRNTDPNDNPSVTFNYFKEPEDLRTCVEGMKTIINAINTKEFSRFRYRDMSVQALINLILSIPANLRPRHVSAAFSLEQFCIDTVISIYHYHGGCQVGKVVDYDYKVIGVDSLRVIDGSTFLSNPGTNPQATVMMFGRYMGLTILHERKKDMI